MQEFLRLLNPWDILFHMINVAVLFVAIRLLLYKPIRGFMEGRARRVEADLDAAAQQRAEADARGKELDKAAQQARMDAAQAIASGVQQGQKTGGEIVERARKQAGELIEQARQEAERIHLEAREAVRAQAVDMAVEIAGRLLEREVRPEDHRRIIDEFLTKVG